MLRTVTITARCFKRSIKSFSHGIRFGKGYYVISKQSVITIPNANQIQMNIESDDKHIITSASYVQIIKNIRKKITEKYTPDPNYSRAINKMRQTKNVERGTDAYLITIHGIESIGNKVPGLVIDPHDLYINGYVPDTTLGNKQEYHYFTDAAIEEIKIDNDTPTPKKMATDSRHLNGIKISQTAIHRAVEQLAHTDRNAGKAVDTFAFLICEAIRFQHLIGNDIGNNLMKNKELAIDLDGKHQYIKDWVDLSKKIYKNQQYDQQNPSVMEQQISAALNQYIQDEDQREEVKNQFGVTTLKNFNQIGNYD